jgi:hypothetical protein
MSIFTRMFRRGGPRDPNDPGENGGQGEEGDATANPSQRTPAPEAGRPEGEMKPDDENTVPWAAPFDQEQTPTPGAKRSPSSFALPPGVVPRPPARTGNGGPPRATGNTRPPPPNFRRNNPSEPPAVARRSPPTEPPPVTGVQDTAVEVTTEARTVTGRGPAVPDTIVDSPSTRAPNAAGSGAYGAAKRVALPALRGVPQGKRTPAAGVPATPPAAPRTAPPHPPPGASGSASRRLPLPLRPPTPGSAAVRARKVSEQPASPSSIEESISREAESRATPHGPRHKPNTSDVSHLLGELDHVSEGRPPTSVGPEVSEETARGVDKITTEQDRAALRELFNELAGHHLAQLRDLMIEVRGGTALSEWIDLSQPAVASVKGMAEQLELGELCRALDALLAALIAARGAGPTITGEARDQVLAAYAPLMDLVPGGLELDAERNRREPVIVHSLLRQIPGVEKMTIDKLVAAGLISIAVLAEARPDELAAVTGMSEELAEQLVARFRAYRAEAGVVASPDPSAEHRSLARLLQTLRQQNRDFDEASTRWSADAKEQKRQLRLERAETLLRIHVSLARLGQVDRLVELDRLSFKRKADFIDTYLTSVRAGRALPGIGPS